MLKKVSVTVLLLVFLSSSLTGCYDAIEIDDQVYVIQMGIDKGINNKIIVTIQYPTYKSASSAGGGSGGGGGKEESNKASFSQEGSNVHSVESSTILEAIDIYGMAISRRISLMHTKTLVFSEEFARSGVGDYLAPMARFRETRRVMDIIVTKGSAQDFLKESKSNIGESLAKATELMAKQTDFTGFSPTTTFHNFYRCMLSTFEQGYAAYAGINKFEKLSDKSGEGDNLLKVGEGYLPGEIPREGVAKREFSGSAIFDGDKMVGTLNSDETRYFLMVSGKFNRAIIDLKDEKASNEAIAIDLRPARAPIIKAYFVNGRPHIDLKLQLEGDILAIQSRINYEKVGMIEVLNRQVEKTITKNVNNVVSKVQHEYKTDIFGFGQKFAAYFNTIQEWEEYNWLAHFKDAKINITVDVNMRRTGLMIKSSPIRGIKGEINNKEK